jgi:RNA polymerase sigma-70 factor (ECF subfamily)
MDADAGAEALLVRQAVAGDRRAYGELVRRHQGRVRALLRRLCREDAALADDLAQDALVQAWRRLEHFRGEAAFGTWLYRIAYNTFLMHARRPSVRSTQALDEHRDDDAGLTAGPAATDLVEQGEVRRALACLSEPERAVIVHCYYLDLSHSEAAFVIGCPLGTLKSHLARALQKLRRRLGEDIPVRI